jgi:LysR family transcriptional regulator, glycine cleavage system transcriptional activator
VRIKATHEVVDLEREGVDLAIRDSPVSNPPAGGLYLVGEHLAAVCSTEYAREARKARRPLAHPSDLKHHTLLYLHDPTVRWPWLQWNAWLEAMGVEEMVPAGALTFDQYDQVMNAALHGQGIALGRMTLASQYLKDKTLVVLFGREQRIPRAFHAVLARDARDRPEVERFVEWLRREIEPVPAALATPG